MCKDGLRRWWLRGCNRDDGSYEDGPASELTPRHHRRVNKDHSCRPLHSSLWRTEHCLLNEAVVEYSWQANIQQTGLKVSA